MKYYILILLILIILSACGQKGDLFLEEPKPPTPMTVPSTPDSEKQPVDVEAAE